MSRTQKIARVLHIILGIGLAIMSFLWLMLVVLLAWPFFTGGLEGVRGKLLHIFLMGRAFDPWPDKLRAVSTGYESLLFYLLLTWALREGYAFTGSLKQNLRKE